MSQQGLLSEQTTAARDIEFITGNIGGPVPPTTGGNIDILGGSGISTTGTPGSNLITIDLTGGAVQQVTTSTSAFISTGVVIPLDNTIPQITEGSQLLSVAITPTKATNRIVVQFSCYATANNLSACTFALFEGAGPNAIHATVDTMAASDYLVNPGFVFTKIAGSTSSLTYSIRFGQPGANTVNVNGLSGGALFGGVSNTVLIITECEV